MEHATWPHRAPDGSQDSTDYKICAAHRRLAELINARLGDKLDHQLELYVYQCDDQLDQRCLEKLIAEISEWAKGNVGKQRDFSCDQTKIEVRVLPYHAPASRFSQLVINPFASLHRRW
jgi:hypothetical protein